MPVDYGIRNADALLLEPNGQQTSPPERRDTSPEGKAQRGIVERILARLGEAALNTSLSQKELREKVDPNFIKRRTDNLLSGIIKSDPFLAIYQQLRDCCNDPLFVYKLSLVEPSLKRLNDQLLGPQITDQFLYEIGEAAKTLFEKQAQQISKKGKSYYFTSHNNQAESLVLIKKDLETFALKQYKKHLADIQTNLGKELEKPGITKEKKDKTNTLICLIKAELASPKIEFDLSFVEIPPTNNENRAHFADKGLFDLELASKSPKEEPKTYNLTDNLQAVFKSYYQLLGHIREKSTSAQKQIGESILLDPSSNRTEWSGLASETISQVRKTTPAVETNSHELQLARFCLQALNGIEVFRPYVKSELGEYAKFAETICLLLENNSAATDSEEIGSFFEAAETLARQSTKVTSRQHAGLSDYGYIAKFLEFYEGQSESNLLTIFLDRIGLAADNYTKIQEMLGEFIKSLGKAISKINLDSVSPSLRSQIDNYQIIYKAFSGLTKINNNEESLPNMEDIDQFLINCETLKLLAANFQEVIDLVDPNGDLLKNFELKIATCTEEHTANFRNSVDQIVATLQAQGLDSAAIYTGGDEVRITMPLTPNAEPTKILGSIQSIVDQTALRAAAVINALPATTPNQIVQTEEDLNNILREIAIALAKIIEQGDHVINALKTNPQDLIPIYTLGTPEALAS